MINTHDSNLRNKTHELHVVCVETTPNEVSSEYSFPSSYVISMYKLIDAPHTQAASSSHLINPAQLPYSLELYSNYCRRETSVGNVN